MKRGGTAAGIIHKGGVMCDHEPDAAGPRRRREGLGGCEEGGLGAPRGRGGPRRAVGPWEPAAVERCECCSEIRPPSRTWAMSKLRHCGTDQHCEHLREEHPGDFSLAVAEARRRIERAARYQAILPPNADEHVLRVLASGQGDQAPEAIQEAIRAEPAFRRRGIDMPVAKGLVAAMSIGACPAALRAALEVTYDKRPAIPIGFFRAVMAKEQRLHEAKAARAAKATPPRHGLEAPDEIEEIGGFGDIHVTHPP